MQNSALFQHFFTLFFTKLARLCALNRQYKPKNKHSPQKHPKFSPKSPNFFKKTAQIEDPEGSHFKILPLEYQIPLPTAALTIQER